MALKQFIPQEFCLRCDVCCRFSQPHTVWAPQDERIKIISHKDYFICIYFNVTDNKCKIYEQRPFECVLYPFLLVLKNKEFYLALDKKCPYLKNLSSNEIKAHTGYLKKELNKKAHKSFLKNNPELFAEYPATDLNLLFSIN